MKNKSVQNCRFVHHAKCHCFMTTLNRLFKIEIQRGGTGKEPLAGLGSMWFTLRSLHSREIKCKLPKGCSYHTGADLGGSLPPLRDSTLYRPKGSPLWYYFKTSNLANRSFGFFSISENVFEKTFDVNLSKTAVKRVSVKT